MPDNKTKQSKDVTKTNRPKPMIPKTTIKPVSKGGNRYSCGGKLKRK